MVPERRRHAVTASSRGNTTSLIPRPRGSPRSGRGAQMPPRRLEGRHDASRRFHALSVRVLMLEVRAPKRVGVRQMNWMLPKGHEAALKTCWRADEIIVT